MYNFIFRLTVERKKEILSDSLDKQQKKKIEREEEKLKNNNRDMSFVKMKSMLAIGFVFTALLGMFNSMLVKYEILWALKEHFDLNSLFCL